MHRNNYHNISNNFVHKETLHPEMNSNQIRQTRSSAAFPAQSPMVALPTPTPIFTKEEVSPVTQTVTQQQQPQPVTLEPSKPSLKHEDGPSTSTSNIPIKMDEDSSNVRPMSEEDLLKLRKINFKKKVSGKEKRVRQNRKLFRILTPRNAIAALNELHGQSINESVVLPAQGNKFEAEITINNVKYTGLGSNKMQAKNAASEQALRDLIIKKFHQIKNQEITIPSSEDDVPMDEDKGDDVPMLQLASYALHKLFAEWEAEGYEIPLPKVNSPTDSALVVSPTGEVKPGVPKAPKIKTELPANNISMHPVMLLSIMRPGTQYSDLGSVGITPNIQHSVGATVDGKSFVGQGRSKKEARKRVATDILIKLFDWKGSCC